MNQQFFEDVRALFVTSVLEAAASRAWSEGAEAIVADPDGGSLVMTFDGVSYLVTIGKWTA